MELESSDGSTGAGGPASNLTDVALGRRLQLVDTWASL